MIARSEVKAHQPRASSELCAAQCGQSTQKMVDENLFTSSIAHIFKNLFFHFNTISLTAAQKNVSKQLNERKRRSTERDGVKW